MPLAAMTYELEELRQEGEVATDDDHGDFDDTDIGFALAI